MTRRVFQWGCLGVLAACASGVLAPKAVRESDFIQKTSVSRRTGYQRALGWFDKNLRFSPNEAQTQDSAMGRMEMRAMVQCNVFRKPSDFKDYYLSFKLYFQSNPQTISMLFRDLRMEDEQSRLITRPELQISSSQNASRIQPCLKKLVADLAKAVESDKLTW